MGKIADPFDVWEKNRLQRDTKKTFPNDIVCHRGCTPRETYWADDKYGSYYLRINATPKEIDWIDNAIQEKRIKLREGIAVEPWACPHGTTYLKICSKDYPLNEKESFVQRVKETGKELRESIDLMELQKIRLEHVNRLRDVRRAFGEKIKMRTHKT